MTLTRRLRASTAILAVLALLHGPVVFAQTVMPEFSGFVKRFASISSLAPQLIHAQKLMRLRKKVKYVFVLLQEDRSFDHDFGAFPGANGLFYGHKPNVNAPGAVQANVNTDATISRFLIPQTVPATPGATVPLYTSDLGDVDHGQTGIAVGIDVDPSTSRSRTDSLAIDDEGVTTNGSGAIVSKTTNIQCAGHPTIIEFINGLTPLTSLPDGRAARAIGRQQ